MSTVGGLIALGFDGFGVYRVSGVRGQSHGLRLHRDPYVYI